jgi:hypothetical protein
MTIKKLALLFPLLIVVVILAGCRPSNEQIGGTVKASMQRTVDSDPDLKNLHLTVDSVVVIRAGDNSYRGLAKVKSDSQSHDIPIELTADGKNVIWHTEPGAFLAFSLADMRRSLKTTPDSAIGTKQSESITDKAIRITQNTFKFRVEQPEEVRHGQWTASTVSRSQTSLIAGDWQFVIVHYSVPSRNLSCEWTLSFPSADPNAYSVDKADECAKRLFDYTSSAQFGLNGQPMLSCREQFGGIRDYYKELITRAYGSPPTLVVTAAGDDTSSPGYGCVASFQFRRANSFHVAKWIMFPNHSQDQIVAVSSDACDLDERRALVENKWSQDPCMPQFSSDVYNPHYKSIRIVETVSAGRDKCEGAVASDMKEHAQSVADFYHVNLSTDFSPVGDAASEEFRCSVLYHVPAYNGDSAPDRLAHWFLYPNRTRQRLVAVNSFACDVEVKRAALHPGEMPVPCDDNGSRAP